MTADSYRTVVILGASYGGAHAAQMLAGSLPPDWRVVAIDRQSHMNHVYVFPRFSVMPEHAPKGFVPYRNIFPPGSRHIHLQGHILSLAHKSVNVLLPDASGSYDGVSDDGSNVPPERIVTVPFEYCIYALGAMLPAPCDVWGEDGREQLPGRGSKLGGVQWMQKRFGVVQSANTVCVVGAGALGIQFAADIKDLWPDKRVTLVHSRDRVLPVYPEEMHEEVMDELRRLGVRVILGQRVVEWPDNMDVVDGTPKVVVTDHGTSVSADLILACTGPKPHSALMASLDRRAIADNGQIRVKPTTQVDTGAPQMGSLTLRDTDLSHMFAIGDCANTTAILAGHTAYWQGEVAARNIQALIDGKTQLEKYTPGPPAIKVTVGIYNYVMASGGVVTFGEDGEVDLQARAMWPVFNAGDCADDE